MATMRELLDTVPQRGRVEWIGLRTARRGAVRVVEEVQAIAGRGLSGDHRSDRDPDPSAKRQVTLVQAEHLPVVAALAGRDGVDPALLRRNLVISGINLLSLKDHRFRIGDAELVGTGECHPCSRMEENLGAGGYQAMRGHGGLTARIVRDGTVRIGADVVPLGPAEGLRGR